MVDTRMYAPRMVTYPMQMPFFIVSAVGCFAVAPISAQQAQLVTSQGELSFPMSLFKTEDAARRSRQQGQQH